MTDSPINLRSLSFDSILKDLKGYVKSLPDYNKWKDFYVSSAGTTFLEMLAGTGAYLSFHSMASRRESYLESARLKSSIYNIAGMLGYEANRRTAPVFRVRIRQDALFDDLNLREGQGFSWGSRFIPVATYKGNDVVLLSEYTYYNPRDIAGRVFDVCLGGWQRQEFNVEETKPFLKLYVEDNSVDNALSHLQVWIRQSASEGRMVLTPVRYAEEMAPPGASSKVLVRTTYDGVVLVFGDGEFGFRPSKGNVCVFDYLSTIGRPVIPISVESLMTELSWATGTELLSNNIESIDVLVPGYDADTDDKIKTLASGYFAARRRMLTADDHKSVLMSYPDIISAGVRRKSSTTDTASCCIVEMSPLFSDEHYINASVREMTIASVTKYDSSVEGISSETVDWLGVDGEGNAIATLKYTLTENGDLGDYVTDELVVLRLYPDDTGESEMPASVSEYPVYYKIKVLNDRMYDPIEDEIIPASFLLVNLDSEDYPLLNGKAITYTGEDDPEYVGTLKVCKKEYLAADREIGGRCRTSVVAEWDIDASTIRTVSDINLLDGMRVRFVWNGALQRIPDGLCFPEPLMSTLLKNNMAEWIVERVAGSATDFKLRTVTPAPGSSVGEEVVFSKYVFDGVEFNTAGTVSLSWDAEVRSALVTNWDLDTGEVTLDTAVNLLSGKKVRFTGVDPAMNDYLNQPEANHGPLHDPGMYNLNDWNKPWARAVVGDTFIPLCLPLMCYSHWGYSPNGDGPTFKVEATDDPRKYRLKDLYGNYLYFNARQTAGTGGCWMMWDTNEVIDSFGTREQRNILTYLDEYRVVGEVIDLIDPVKIILQVKMTIVVDDTVTVSELEEEVTRIVKSKVYQMGVTFRPGEVVSEVSQITGVKRVYLQWPTKDKELAYNEYLGFDTGAYVDMIIRQAVYGDKLHYIAPLDLSITSDTKLYIGMEPDSYKGYYSEAGEV